MQNMQIGKGSSISATQGARIEAIRAARFQMPMQVAAYYVGNNVTEKQTRLKAAAIPNLDTKIMIGTKCSALFFRNKYKIDPMIEMVKEIKNDFRKPRNLNIAPVKIQDNISLIEAKIVLVYISPFMYFIQKFTKQKLNDDAIQRKHKIRRLVAFFLFFKSIFIDQSR
ncbi:UNKNOWN [Stylonychia lemnae]|uniref:Uncharacterized protein n=1 Tax=Stylonychia lemnae TaxID=5949 RepID=A0A078AQ82_STYLE|nr:UNKNOWN [Stylonychia lemnae]|eukprot:CDW84324.1 UNKNOWN [Stylonychia lemnae]